MGEAAALGGVLGRAAGSGLVLPVNPAVAVHAESPRVLFVIPGEAQGSSMIFARRQAASLAQQGVEVHMFHLRSRTSPTQLCRELIRFRRRMQKIQPHVIHAHFGTMTALFAAWAAPRRPLVITFRGSDLNAPPANVRRGARWRAWAGQMLSQVAALRAVRIICVSRELRERLWWRRGSAVVLPSGVDPDIFYPEDRELVRARLGWSGAERVVLFNAGLDPAIKRADLARHAVALAEDRLEGVRMEMLDGKTPAARVPDLLNGADCLLLTSDLEGSPTVIQEALACNLPVVSVEAGDIVERLRHVQHCAVVARDPAAIAAGLVRVLRVPMRSNGRDKVREFSARKIAGELRRIYAEAGAG